ncbi:RNA polymerase I-specific transcription initiation factor RRN3 [Linum grandiflorum]
MGVDKDFTDSQAVYGLRLALRSISLPSGDNKDYNKLVGNFNDYNDMVKDYSNVKEASILTAMKALSEAVADLDNHRHELLLRPIFNMSLWELRPNVMDALLGLIISMAASNGKFVKPCLDMLINTFTPPKKILDALTEPVRLERKERVLLRIQAALERKERVLTRIHAALKDLSELVPMAASMIPSILLEHMPWNPRRKYDQLPMKSQYGKHDQLPVKNQLIFVENMLKLERGDLKEFVGSSVLRLLMIMLRDVDVSIGCDNILHEDSSKGIFSMELEDEFSSTLSQKSFSNNAMAEMLDSLMVQTFKHLDSAADDKRLREVFDMLLPPFEEAVLTTDKTKFVQFVMFYACALDHEHCGQKFADWLINMFFHDVNPLKRMSAVAYLASFLARSKLIPPEFVLSFLRSLVDWCCQYCAKHDSDMNPILHKVFYSACQAIMYVLCFRMRSIVGIPEVKSQLFCIFKHRLNPLRVCLPSIVEEFLTQAKAARLFTSSDLLVLDRPRSSGGLHLLDMFFPFDPCMLKESDRIIQHHYVYWKCVKTSYDEDTDLEEGGSDEEEAVDDYEVMYTEEGILQDDHDMADVDNALSKMSFTPRNSSLEHRFGAEGLRMPSRIRPSMSPESL